MAHDTGVVLAGVVGVMRERTDRRRRGLSAPRGPVQQPGRWAHQTGSGVRKRLTALIFHVSMKPLTYSLAVAVLCFAILPDLDRFDSFEMLLETIIIPL